jgi:hypothetical protein
MIRILVRIVVVLALVYAAAVACLAVAMRQPPDTFGRIMAKLPPIAFMTLPFEPLWMSARAGKIEPRQQAPDFSLKPLDGGASVQLSSFRGERPVVLVFGSYT